MEPYHLPDGKVPSSWGIVPRACFEVFEAVQFRENNLNLDIEAKVYVSYVEIYGDEVNDLLRSRAPCGPSRVTAQRYVLDGSAEVPAASLTECLHLLNRGEKQKRKAFTAMNHRSSRAHSVLILRLEQHRRDTGATSSSRLFCVDLGGSEQVKKSLVSVTPEISSSSSSSSSEKDRLAETVYINLGLLALKRCVIALGKKTRAPYSESKLTMMLSPGLSGNGKTCVVVCGSQEERHAAETISAMKFGQVCRGISQTAWGTNTFVLKQLLENMDARIALCEENIRKRERWEVRHEERFREDGQVLETRQVTVVVGAENYRQELASLLRKKMELTGDSIHDLYADDEAIPVGFGDAHMYGMGSQRV